ncbi:MAG: 3-dehydroquinate synthase [Phycisphaerae bacterium]|nr:3-dehydroquinate synthase [Phycisphaerae bacterium]HAW95805.1 3-dehydroquinate synthase [Phycisphaerales bacterium]|tara:strand:+ start:81 stop:1262 length:1182 start_codon:yes stop_codon:yes gene_type:complete
MHEHSQAQDDSERFTQVERFTVQWSHGLFFSSHTFDPANPVLADAIRGADDESSQHGMIVVIDEGVTDTNPDLQDRIRRYVEAHRDSLPELRTIHVTPGGEISKNDPRMVDEILDLINEHGICRRSTVLVIGGGAVLDSAGYAAATAHRGVRIVRMPTTVLSQADSGVGVKNGINRYGKKNFTGTFTPPNAVVCDTRLLESLSDAEWITGFSEVVKIALLKDADLFERMERDVSKIRERDLTVAIGYIFESARRHLEHITRGGDPFESHEARPLDYGHWSAHKLEQMTNFELRHGDAVSMGIALDSIYAGLMGMESRDSVERTIALLEKLGLPIFHPCMSQTDVLIEGLQEFREHLGGKLTITLVTEPGSSIEVNEIDEKIMMRAIEELSRRT